MNENPKRNSFAKKFTEFRHSLSYIDALPQLTLLGLFVGLITGGIIVAFRLIIELPLQLFLPEHPENFEALSITTRLIFIFAGITLLIIVLQFIPSKDREGSVSHVIDRMHNHQAKLPFKNWCVQFIGAAICLATGQSVGREGPAVHLGAGAASQFGQWLKLPNNSIHTLVGCGVAAAISASFDTPMAGVIFAMEVLAMEYTIVGFVPVILASVMGTVISKAAFGGAVFITVGDTNIGSLFEIPFMVVVGVVIALCAGAYIRLNIFALKFKHRPLSIRLVLAGLITAASVTFVPQIMGQGYDTVNSALESDILIWSLLTIGLVKLTVTPIVIGLGVPGGLIGPMLVIGACIGGTLGVIAIELFPDLGASADFYVMMGMAGMMAAALNAPLAALVTVLELSYNPNIIFPAMLVIVVACVMTRQLFKVKGIFLEQLHHSDRPLDFGPAKQALRRAGVRSVMDSRFVITQQILTAQQAQNILVNHPMWLIITDEDNRYTYAMRAADLANHLEQLKIQLLDDENEEDTCKDDEVTQKQKLEELWVVTYVDLLDIPSRNYRIGAIHETASLYEAMLGFGQDSTEILYVSGQRTPYSGDVKGILTLSSIENYYKPVELRNVVD